MAYPTGMLSLTLEDVDRQIASLKLYATQVRAELAAGNVPSSRILDMFVNLKQTRVALVAAAAAPGLATYAQAQKNLPGLDVAAAFTGVIGGLDGVTTWIAANFPKDGSGFLLAQTLDANNGPVDRLFAPATTAGMRTVLDALIAAIA